MNFDQSQTPILPSNTSSNIQENTPQVPSWEELGRIQVMRSWAKEINANINGLVGLDEWRLSGVAVTIEHSDIEHCRDILARVAKDAGINFLVLTSKEIEQKFSEESVELKVDAPALIYLEPGLWMNPQEDKTNPIIDIQNKLCESIRKFDENQPILYATSTASLNDFAEEFRKVGLFDRRFTVVEPTLEELALKFIREIGEEHCGSTLKENLGKVGKLIDLDFDDKRRRQLISLTLKRTAVKENRLVEFEDLVDLAAQGSNEYDPYPEKTPEETRQVAVHEAGHALVAMIDSEYKNIPEYISIVECVSFNGIVSDSYDYHLSKNRSLSYYFLRHQIRTTLAGRVAEHFVFGSGNVRIGSAKGDLRKATNICFDMFTSRGFSDEMESDDRASKNLIIELENPSQAYLEKIETMVTNYLDRQYKIVYQIINENKAIFELLVENLLDKKILSHNEIKDYFQ